jgi:hypothetical protein
MTMLDGFLPYCVPKNKVRGENRPDPVLLRELWEDNGFLISDNLKYIPFFFKKIFPQIKWSFLFLFMSRRKITKKE